MAGSGRNLVRLMALGASVFLVLMTTAVGLSASGEVKLKASIDGRDVSDSSDQDPVVLDPQGSPILRVRVENNGDRTITIRTVRLEGSVIGLTFYSYDTAVGMKVAPGEEDERAFEMDLVGLDGQAVGLIPSSVKVLDPDRKSLAGQSLVVDVRGSLRSVYGIFGLIIVAVTLAALAQALFKLARHTLPPNRWKRGLRFATPGVGAGLTAVFTLSALAIFAPLADKWIPLVAGGGLIGFLVGYLTPSPEEEEEQEEEEEEEEEMEEGEPYRATLRETASPDQE